mmetsp:Transcript_52073/g.76239  ORF Transcript_52073/g.76239 Transcript_52073/m.76239 type:complete len:259 (-) Transcript_52073:10-786(-)
MNSWRSSVLAVALGVQAAVAFQAPCLTSTSGHHVSIGLRSGVSTMSLTAVSRRAAILTGGVSFVSGLVYGTHPVFAAQPDLAIAEVVKAGVKKIATGGSQPIPADAQVVGIVDDGSSLAAAAKLGVAAAGATVVALKGSVEEMQAIYFKNDCNAAVVPNAKTLKDVMVGEGLNCNGCSYGGGQSPPSWFIVMDSNGKTDEELQNESELTGRICSKDTPGVCFQMGIAVPVYSRELLPKLKIISGDDRPPCTGRFEGIC